MGDPGGKGSSEERKGSGFGSTMFGLLNTVTGNASKVRTVDACRCSQRRLGSLCSLEIGRRVRVRLVGQSCGVRRRYDDEGSSAALHSARRRPRSQWSHLLFCIRQGVGLAVGTTSKVCYRGVAPSRSTHLRSPAAQPADVCLCVSVRVSGTNNISRGGLAGTTSRMSISAATPAKRSR